MFNQTITRQSLVSGNRMTVNPLLLLLSILIMIRYESEYFCLLSLKNTVPPESFFFLESQRLFNLKLKLHFILNFLIACCKCVIGKPEGFWIQNQSIYIHALIWKIQTLWLKVSFLLLHVLFKEHHINRLFLFYTNSSLVVFTLVIHQGLIHHSIIHHLM